MENSLEGSTTVFQIMGLQFFSLNAEIFQNRQKDEISKKHKLLIALTVVMLTMQLYGIYYAINLEKMKQQSENVLTGLNVQFSVYILMIVVICVAIAHSFASTRKTKKIFSNLDQILKIFVNDIGENIDYRGLSRRFKWTLIKITLCFITSTVIVLGFIYNYNQSSIFLWALLAIYPYFFIALVHCHFMFYILLIKENLQCMYKVLEKLYKHQQTSMLIMDFRAALSAKLPRKTSDELFDKMIKLKKIYWILFETTSLINELNGPPFMNQLIVLILGNISAGYKVYLSLMGDIVIERTGGKTALII